MGKFRLDIQNQKNEIIRLYTEDLKSCKEIATVFRCGLSTISRLLKKNGVLSDSPAKRQAELWVGGKFKHWKKGLTKEIDERVKVSGEKLSKTRKELYKTGKLKSWAKGLTKETDERLRKAGEKISETRKRLFKEGKLDSTPCFPKGEKHPFFNNWSSLLPYDKNFNRKFKKLIKERDGCCMICNIGFEDLKSLKRQSCIHHIDYNKKLTIPQNCINLCVPCHAKTQINRISWTKFFQSLLSEKYGYQYSETGEVILKLNSLGGAKC